MKLQAICLAGVALMLAGLCRAQDARIAHHAFSAGAVTARDGNTVVTALVGQTFVGSAEFENTILEAGFLVDTLFRPAVVGVQEDGALPQVFALEQNYPNPFNPSTTIRFALPKRTRLSLRLYNVLGQEVRTLIDDERPAGYHQVVLQARGLASGVYVYRMVAADVVMTRKLIVLK